jgi:hypothetical protein
MTLIHRHKKWVVTQFFWKSIARAAKSGYLPQRAPGMGTKQEVKVL